MRVADFYCGGGGFSEGFRQAGFEIVFAVDKWEPAVKTARANKPDCVVIQDDVIRISKLPDAEFNELIPDTEIIIGSPPCIAFSSSNKAGNGDKTLGLELLKAYLRIVARKKYKDNSILQYWVLENVPNIEKYIKEEYYPVDLEVEGDFCFRPKGESAGIYNAKNFGAPTNRKRFFCGDFPIPEETHTDETVLTLKRVLDSLGKPKKRDKTPIEDCCYPGLSMDRKAVTDHHYDYYLQSFEWEKAKRLKEDRGYMGRMAFPENLDKPSRTVMATMSSSSRESMVLSDSIGNYRLPTIREVATMMSFPIDYQFYGSSKGIKHTLVGNAVPPKMSYAIAKAIAIDSGRPIPECYIPIQHKPEVEFKNLNNESFEPKKEKVKRDIAKFKYHIPYLIEEAFRVELTNNQSVFDVKDFKWSVEIHHGQGKNKARIYNPFIKEDDLDKVTCDELKKFTKNIIAIMPKSHNRFQEIHCMTSEERNLGNFIGPYELLNLVKEYLTMNRGIFTNKYMHISEELPRLPQIIGIGYFILNQMVESME